jgi:rod shape-determining protein MreD
MPPVRVAVGLGLLVVALATQVTMLARLPLPGATPDLVLVTVVALALAYGPAYGLVAGFGAGLATDLVPPADGAVGRWAFVLTLVGYLAGLAKVEIRRSAFVPLIVVSVAAGLSVVLYAVLAALSGDEHVTRGAVVALLPTAVLYAVVLTPFVVPGVLVLADRVEPDPVLLR